MRAVMANWSDFHHVDEQRMAGWRPFVPPALVLLVGALAMVACLVLVNSSLHQQETVEQIARLRSDIFALASIENEAEAGETVDHSDRLHAVSGRLAAHLDAATARLARREAETVRAEAVAYKDAVETTVAGFTANDEDAAEFDDDVTEPLFLSLTSRLDRLATNVDTAARRTAVVATRSLGVILAAMLVGVIVLFVVGARFQRRAEARREAARLDARFRGIVENSRSSCWSWMTTERCATPHRASKRNSTRGRQPRTSTTCSSDWRRDRARPSSSF